MNRTDVNPDMIILARESRGLTQGELAEKCGIGQSVLSKYENGLLAISQDQLRPLARALGYPESLFARFEPIYGFGSSCMYHRRRQTISVNILRRIQAQVNLKRMHIKSLLRSGIEIDVARELPRIDIGDYKNAEQIADLVRRTWGLPLGPIRNLISIVESAGGIVIQFSFGTNKLDAISQWPPDMPPLFFINSDMPWERIRFSLAHEIGHLIMHKEASNNQEEEADAFASAFLMPAREISADLSGITVARAAHLKPYWKVSMQALIRRAYNLRKISESQYRRLFTEISRMGYRRHEPIDIPSEEPRVFQDLLGIHLREHRYSYSDLGRLCDLYEHEFVSSYIPRETSVIRIAK